MSGFSIASPAGAATRPGVVAAPATARAVFAVALVAALGVGLLATGTQDSAHAVAAAGPELTRLLRAMAAIKSVMAASAAAAVWWRLGMPVGPARLVAYALSGAAMASGPAIIWMMAHVGFGALLLHGGLAAAILLLWRDPAVGARLGVLVAARRRALG